MEFRVGDTVFYAGKGRGVVKEVNIKSPAPYYVLFEDGHTWWSCEGSLRLEKSKKEGEEMKTYYKALIIGDDGNLWSIIAGRGLAGLTAQDKPSLEYKEGAITYNPEGEQGIFVHETKDAAYSQANSYRRGKTAVIHEATALGETLGLGRPGVRFPAILLGKRVETLEDEAPKFEVGDFVTIRPDLETASHGWGVMDEHKDEVGVVKDVDTNTISALFPSFLSATSGWSGLPTEFRKLDTAPKFKIGDKVVTTASNRGTPKGTIGKVSRIRIERGVVVYDVGMFGGLYGDLLAPYTAPKTITLELDKDEQEYIYALLGNGSEQICRDIVKSRMKRWGANPSNIDPYKVWAKFEKAIGR